MNPDKKDQRTWRGFLEEGAPRSAFREGGIVMHRQVEKV
jgi:hypothetical protein